MPRLVVINSAEAGRTFEPNVPELTIGRDGHATQPSLEFLFNNTTATALCSWNRDNQPHADRIR